MYTWGDIKYIILAKINLTDPNEPDNETLINTFPYYANEAMTQICSAVKPKNTYIDVEVTERYSVVDIMSLDPNFVRFGDDINYYKSLTTSNPYDELLMNDYREASDDEFVYYGYSSLLFKKTGKYKISYDTRWFTFDVELEDDVVLPIPADILDAIPSYVASQCLKVDDEIKASIYRNEFEMAVARIDNTTYKNSKTLKLGGDWD